MGKVTKEFFLSPQLVPQFNLNRKAYAQSAVQAKEAAIYAAYGVVGSFFSSVSLMK